jgi:hypothetical protein
MGNQEMNIKVFYGNFSTIFEREQKLTKAQEVEKINRELAKLDQQILIMQNDYRDLILKKELLMYEIKEEKENGK